MIYLSLLLFFGHSSAFSKVNDSWEEVARESGTHCARTQLVEALHREAFRGSGLANSLLAPEHNIRHMVRVLKIFSSMSPPFYLLLLLLFIFCLFIFYFYSLQFCCFVCCSSLFCFSDVHFISTSFFFIRMFFKHWCY